MKVTEDTQSRGYTIRAYSAEAITVAGRPPSYGETDAGPLPLTEVFTRSFVIAPDQLLRDWPPQQLDELEPHHLAALLPLQPELVLLGSGTRFRFPAQDVLQTLAAHGIGIEVMDTGAACRTYNVLAGEGRRVVAALLLGE